MSLFKVIFPKYVFLILLPECGIVSTGSTLTARIAKIRSTTVITKTINVYKKFLRLCRFDCLSNHSLADNRFFFFIIMRSSLAIN
ncbi:hypothetical protein SEVCU122_0470 [Staphylococcus hominis VCU122]|nr:hypothetical protein SEVCU122_0470 [Staphylococcus hominis VCU122]